MEAIDKDGMTEFQRQRAEMMERARQRRERVLREVQAEVLKAIGTVPGVTKVIGPGDKVLEGRDWHRSLGTAFDLADGRRYRIEVHWPRMKALGEGRPQEFRLFGPHIRHTGNRRWSEPYAMARTAAAVIAKSGEALRPRNLHERIAEQANEDRRRLTATLEEQPYTPQGLRSAIGVLAWLAQPGVPVPSPEDDPHGTIREAIEHYRAWYDWQLARQLVEFLIERATIAETRIAKRAQESLPSPG